MIKRVNNPKELGAVINEEYQGDILYDLGEGGKRTELIVTHVDESLGENKVVKSDRIAYSPLIRLYEDNEGILIDVTDSDSEPLYEGLRPQEAIFEDPEHPDYELGDLQINLNSNGNEYLGITQFYRSAA
tara:strand:- start:1481 stop:1870 length:390 start_codon:yes stop_codon:yes gene_type:complete